MVEPDPFQQPRAYDAAQVLGQVGDIRRWVNDLVPLERDAIGKERIAAIEMMIDDVVAVCTNEPTRARRELQRFAVAARQVSPLALLALQQSAAALAASDTKDPAALELLARAQALVEVQSTG